MTTHDNAPPPPDWQPNPGHRCGGCDGTANLCHVLKSVDGYPCCENCTHEPKVWRGDNA